MTLNKKTIMNKLILKRGTGSSFSRAFAQARKQGLKTFYYRGKKYGTQLANEVKQDTRKVESTAKETARKASNILNNAINYVDSALSTSTTQPKTSVSTAFYKTSQPVVGDTNLPWSNLERTYFFKPKDVKEGEMWGIGSEAHPKILPQITVTATKPREAYDVKSHSQSNKLGNRYQGVLCAKWRNDQLNNMGYEIYGDAWTTPTFADKVYSGFEGLKRPFIASKKNLENFRKLQ